MKAGHVAYSEWPVPVAVYPSYLSPGLIPGSNFLTLPSRPTSIPRSCLFCLSRGSVSSSPDASPAQSVPSPPARSLAVASTLRRCCLIVDCQNLLRRACDSLRSRFWIFRELVLGEVEWWFLRRETQWAGAARLELPVSTVSVRALVSRKGLLNLSRTNQTLGLIVCNSYVEGEHCLCVKRGSRSCLEVCSADVIRKFQI